MRARRADRLHVVSALASRDGLRNAQAWLPEGTTFLLGGVDPTLDERGYIVPGLGDAGDLAFGPKHAADRPEAQTSWNW